MKEKAYLKLYHQLREEIVAGVYAPGARLPSKRGMAEKSGVSVITVEHAYAILADEGYIEPRRRSGYYVCYLAEHRGEQGDQITAPPRPIHVHAHTGESDFPFSVLAKTMRRVLGEYGSRNLVKSPNHGCPELRRAIAAYLARMNGMRVRAEQIIIGSGAEYLYSLIAQLLGRDTIAVENPSYDKIRRVYEACGVTVEPLRMGADGIKSNELQDCRSKVLHVTPFHSFPSGVTATATKRQEYIDWAVRRSGYIIEDNYDSELTVSTKSEDTLFSLSGERVLYLNTFSGTVAPSIRVGYMVLPEALLETFDRQLGFYSCTVPVFEQYVLAELIETGDFERHIQRVRRMRRKQKMT